MIRYFSENPAITTGLTRINRAEGIIYDVAIAQAGPAKGHQAYIDKTFLLQIVEKAAPQKKGIKARFGHPNMCSTALGTYLGRFNNYAYHGDKVTADLYLDETAKKSPNGDLYTYILDMAEKAPDMFGASIAFIPDQSVMLEEEVEGNKVTREYFRLLELKGTDLVDEPAATDQLFSAETMPGIATRFLEENPQLLEVILSNPNSIPEFLTNFVNNTHMTLSEKIRENLNAFLARFSAPTASTSLSETDVTAGLSDHASTTLSATDATAGLSDNATLPVETETVPDPDALAEIKEAQLQEDKLSMLFDTLSAAFPEDLVLKTTEDTSAALSDREDEKLLAIAGFIEKLSTGLSASNAQLAELKEQLASANSEIADLQVKLTARPSIPLNVTDPLVSVNATATKDETGKQILANIPKDLKRKLK